MHVKDQWYFLHVNHRAPRIDFQIWKEMKSIPEQKLDLYQQWSNTNDSSCILCLGHFENCFAKWDFFMDKKN